MKVVYEGPYEGVEVPLPSGGAVYAEHGVEVELYDEVAESLLEQEDIWVDPTASDEKTPAPSKRVKEVAAELGVDLDTVTGTGKNDAITVGDIRAAAEAAEPAQVGAGEGNDDSADGATEED